MPGARGQVALAYLAFILIGISAGVGGVLLPAQIADYGVDRATIGLTFFTFALGFILSGAVSGPLIHRLGMRRALVVAGSTTVIAGLFQATRPPLAALIAVQVLAGLGSGVGESALNVHLSQLPRAPVLLGRLHAFFGVGALTGPPLAAWALRSHPWTAVTLLVALSFVPLIVAMAVVFRDEPGPTRPAPTPSSAPTAASAPTPASALTPGELPVAPAGHGQMLLRVVREPAVALAATFLAVYVGMEISIGNWGYSYLIGERHQSGVLAGYSVSGFWLGLTVGRFVISPVAERLRWTTGRTSTACLTAIAVTVSGIALVPAAGVSSAGLAVAGFFLGPLFPTTMAVVPQLTEARHVPTAIGVLNGASSAGGSALPWLAGALTQSAGLWLLMPFVAILALVQLALWRSLLARADALPETPVPA